MSDEVGIAGERVQKGARRPWPWSHCVQSSDCAIAGMHRQRPTGFPNCNGMSEIGGVSIHRYITWMLGRVRAYVDCSERPPDNGHTGQMACTDALTAGLVLY
jgi:hypothetical protein